MSINLSSVRIHKVQATKNGKWNLSTFGIQNEGEQKKIKIARSFREHKSFQQLKIFEMQNCIDRLSEEENTYSYVQPFQCKCIPFLWHAEMLLTTLRTTHTKHVNDVSNSHHKCSRNPIV